MDISRIAKNRMMEAPHNIVQGDRKLLLSHVRRLEEQQIIDRLKTLGIDVDREWLHESIVKYPSSEELCKDFDCNDEEFLWMGITVLWERWFPEIPNFEMLDDKINLGYVLEENGETEDLYNTWWSAWQDIKYLMDRFNIIGVKGFDKRFKGTQDVFNWAFDFELSLANLSFSDESYAQKRIEFCSEYINRSTDETINIENMKKAIAESYFQLGNTNEGDKCFEAIVNEYPDWEWGWIAWHDCYTENNNNEKAEAILKNALSKDELRDNEDILDRLMDFYKDNKRNVEAEVIKKQLELMRKASKEKLKNSMPVEEVKVGRNDPCPCGSGKKYKKCCGN